MPCRVGRQLCRQQRSKVRVAPAPVGQPGVVWRRVGTDEADSGGPAKVIVVGVATDSMRCRSSTIRTRTDLTSCSIAKSAMASVAARDRSTSAVDTRTASTALLAASMRSADDSGAPAAHPQSTSAARSATPGRARLVAPRARPAVRGSIAHLARPPARCSTPTSLRPQARWTTISGRTRDVAGAPSRHEHGQAEYQASRATGHPRRTLGRPALARPATEARASRTTGLTVQLETA